MYTFVPAFTHPNFYIELICAGVALALAWLVGNLVSQYVLDYAGKKEKPSLDPALLAKPLTLLTPLLAILYLGIGAPVAAQYADGGLIDALLRLAMAYVVAKGVVLIVQSRPVAYFIAGLVLLVAMLKVLGYLQTTLDYLRSVYYDIGDFRLSLLNVIHGIIILVVVFWAAGAMSRTLEDYLRRSSSLSYSTRELIAKFFRIFVYFVALMVTLSALGVDLTAFAVFGGALGVGIGLGLQKITSNFVSGVTLLMEKSIKIGDLIEIGGQTGWVRQLNIRYALIETADGREITVPNEDLISTRVINWTHSNDRARVEIKAGVAYGADPKQVKKLLLEAAMEHKRCLKDPPPTCWLREFGDNSLNFLLTFWVGDVNEGRYGPQSDVMISILGKFAAAGIEIPFPQRVVHMQKTMT